MITDRCEALNKCNILLNEKGKMPLRENCKDIIRTLDITKYS